MENKTKFRHELKYFIHWHEYIHLKQRLEAVLHSDTNASSQGSYQIRSLYFDDMYNSAYKEKSAGLKMRKKYRIRIYNHSDDLIKLECKRKSGSMTNKVQSRITRDQAHSLIRGEGEFLLGSGQPFMQDLYIDMRTRQLKPVVIVDYEREPYVFDAGNVRVTFDKTLEASGGNEDMFDSSIVSKRVFDVPTVIMEVKYDDFLPAHVRNLIQVQRHSMSAISKFVLCRDAMRQISGRS